MSSTNILQHGDVPVAILNRLQESSKQTLGHLTIYNGVNVIYQCYTLELPWKNNERQKSCIPVGEYTVIKRVSAKFGKHFHITNVPGRDFVLIHQGNFHSDIQGCILVGAYLQDLNKDGELDVAASSLTLQNILKLTNNLTLIIR